MPSCDLARDNSVESISHHFSRYAIVSIFFAPLIPNNTKCENIAHLKAIPTNIACHFCEKRAIRLQTPSQANSCASFLERVHKRNGRRKKSIC